MATLPEEEKPVDANRLSDAEKDLKADSYGRLAGFEDPDAGLSEEERAKIVCTPILTVSSHLIPVLHALATACRSMQVP